MKKKTTDFHWHSDLYVSDWGRKTKWIFSFWRVRICTSSSRHILSYVWPTARNRAGRENVLQSFQRGRVRKVLSCIGEITAGNTWKTWLKAVLWFKALLAVWYKEALLSEAAPWAPSWFVFLKKEDRIWPSAVELHCCFFLRSWLHDIFAPFKLLLKNLLLPCETTIPVQWRNR